MPELITMNFGYFPCDLEVTAGDVSIVTLPNLDDKVSKIETDKYLRKD